MSIEDLRTRAETGSVVAQTVLGVSHLHGSDTPRDHAEALRWLSAASQRGAPRASVWLGTMYEQGLGVTVDIARAKALYQSGAERGEFFGCIFLARILASGAGGPVDERGAVRWFQRALAMSVENCPELEEAQSYVASHPDAAA